MPDLVPDPYLILMDLDSDPGGPKTTDSTDPDPQHWIRNTGECNNILRWSLFFCSGQQQHQNVFDRRAKLIQKERAAANPLVADYDFLKEEIGYRHVLIFPPSSQI